MALVGEANTRSAQAEPVQEQPGWGCLGVRGRGIGIGRQRGEYAGHIQAAVLLEDQIEFGLLEADLGEGPGPAKQAGEFEIHHQPAKCRKRGTIALGKAKVIGLEAEAKRIQAQIAKACLKPQRFTQ